MKKILFISSQPFFEWRGSPIRVGFNLLALGERYEVDFLTLPIGRQKSIPGVRVIRVPGIPFVRTIPIGPSLGKAFFDIWLLLFGLFLVFRNSYAVIHAVEDASFPGLILARIKKVKFVFEKHSDVSSYMKKGVIRNGVLRIYQKLETFIIRYSDAVIGTGPALAVYAKKVFPQQKVYMIPDIPSSLKNPDENEAVRIGRNLRKKDGEMLILYAGSFAVYQGIDLLFESVPLVLSAFPDSRFVVIGGSESEISVRKKWLVSKGVGSQVEFLGKLEPDVLPDYFSACDVLLSPRISGANTPLKLLDYLKAGKVIVGTAIDANRQILNLENSILTECNPEGFSEGILTAIRNSKLSESLAKNGKKLIDEKHNFAYFRACLHQCYDEL